MIAEAFDSPRSAIVTVLLLTAVALGLVALSLDGDDVVSSAPTTTARAVSATTTTPGPATTVAPTTTLLAGPRDNVEEALAAWPTLGAAKSEHVAGPVLDDGIPTAVVGAGTEVAVWRWDGSDWARGDALRYNGGLPPVGLTQVAMVDLTGDGLGEVVISYAGPERTLGEVFTAADGIWRPVPFDLSLLDLPPGSVPQSLSYDDAGLRSSHAVCTPSCAEGPVLDVRLEWMGDRFTATSRSCPTWTDRGEGTALGLCDGGPGVVGLQAALIYFGHLGGTADGRFGWATYSAVLAYQAGRGLPATGRIEADQVAALIADHAAASAPPPPATDAG